jgi:hypothetical protein
VVAIELPRVLVEGEGVVVLLTERVTEGVAL